MPYGCSRPRPPRRRAVGAVALISLLVGGCTAARPADPPAPGASAAASAVPGATAVPEADAAPRVLATDLDNPWEITWGPDGALWVTEKSAGRVTRVAARDGTRRTAVRIPDVLATSGGQDGLLGMALHPKLLRQPGDQFVYLAYTYDADAGRARDRRTKIVRYTYDRAAQTLGRPTPVLVGLPGSADHQAGRLAFGPDGKLYYSAGDQGRNQFDEKCKPILAQRLPTAAEVKSRDWTAYQGKILRLDPDGSVPADNPVLGGVRSHVYSYGHRNAQGLAFAGGRLYSSEQGPKTDDELNQIRAGGNYGWPRVVGYADDKEYVYGNWSASRGQPCAALSYSDLAIADSVPQQKESQFDDPAAVEPLRTFHTVAPGHDFEDPKCADAYYICWPTVAPSGLDVHPGGCLSTAGPALLMPSLKDGVVYRLPLGADGATIGEPTPLWRTVNRYRDTAVSGDGSRVYVATDTGGTTRDRSGAPTAELADPGAILEFRCAGAGGSVGR